MYGEVFIPALPLAQRNLDKLYQLIDSPTPEWYAERLTTVRD